MWGAWKEFYESVFRVIRQGYKSNLQIGLRGLFLKKFSNGKYSFNMVKTIVKDLNFNQSWFLNTHQKIYMQQFPEKV